MQGSLIAPLFRLLPVGLTALAIQRVVFARHPVFDVKLQFVLALVVATGAVGGADRGAIAGFVLGLLYDASGNTPMGLMALAYGIGGMTAGYVQSITPDPQWWLASIFAAVGGMIGELGVPVAEAVRGESGWLDRGLLSVVPIVGAGAAVMCPLLMPVGRWMMGVKRKKWKAIPE